MPEIVPMSDLDLHEHVSRFEGADHGSQVSFFYSRNEPGGGATLHRHPYEETFVVLEGTTTFTVDGERLEVEAGNVVIVPAGAEHGFVASGDGPIRQLSIHPSPRVEQVDLAG